jgi:selenocysteine lyase/cysteine desulfurase
MTWLSGNDLSYIRNAEVFSPGGWQAYDHRWSVGEAFQFHMAIGKDRVESRIHEFATVMKEEMARMPHVKLYTPMAEELSSGLICFDVDGMTQNEVIAALHDRGILAGATPYQVSYARVTPGLLNSESEIETTLSAIRDLGT